MADLSGEITSGGTAQTIAAFNPARRSIFFQNLSDEDMWMRFGGTAAADRPSFLVPAGENLTLGSDHRELIVRSISVYGTTTGKEFTAYDSSV